MSALQTLRYGIETFRYAGQYQTELEQALGVDEYQTHSDALRQTSGLSSAGFGILGVSAYDMCLSESPDIHSEKPRNWVRFHAALAIHFTDITDDIIDDPVLQLTPEEKQTTLERIIDEALTPRNKVTTLNGEMSRVAVIAGSYLLDKLGSRGLFRGVLDRYPAIEGGVPEFPTFSHMQRYIESIGTCAGDIIVAPSEVAFGEIPSRILTAYQLLGCYAMVLDHSYEIADDIHENSTSLITVQLTEAMSPQEILQLRTQCSDMLSTYNQKAQAGLSVKERTLFKSIRHMLDVRYKLIKQFSDNRKLRKLTPADSTLPLTR